MKKLCILMAAAMCFASMPVMAEEGIPSDNYILEETSDFEITETEDNIQEIAQETPQEETQLIEGTENITEGVTEVSAENSCEENIIVIETPVEFNEEKPEVIENVPPETEEIVIADEVNVDDPIELQTTYKQATALLEWDDMNNKFGLRPSKVTVQIKKNGANYQTLELNASNNWQHKFRASLESGESSQNYSAVWSIPSNYLDNGNAAITFSSGSIAFTKCLRVNKKQTDAYWKNSSGTKITTLNLKRGEYADVSFYTVTDGLAAFSEKLSLSTTVGIYVSPNGEISRYSDIPEEYMGATQTFSANKNVYDSNPSRLESADFQKNYRIFGTKVGTSTFKCNVKITDNAPFGTAFSYNKDITLTVNVSENSAMPTTYKRKINTPDLTDITGDMSMEYKLKNSSGTVIDTWYAKTRTSHEVTLSKGSYTVTGKPVGTVPNYNVSADASFTVTDNDTSNEIIVSPHVSAIGTKVYTTNITTPDLTSYTGNINMKYSLKNTSTGNIVEIWYSKGNATWSKQVPAGTYKIEVEPSSSVPNYKFTSNTTLTVGENSSNSVLVKVTVSPVENGGSGNGNSGSGGSGNNNSGNNNSGSNSGGNNNGSGNSSSGNTGNNSGSNSSNGGNNSGSNGGSNNSGSGKTGANAGGSSSANETINLAGVKSFKAKKGKKKCTLKWKKAKKKEQKTFDYYEIQYSKNSNFSNAKTKTAKKGAAKLNVKGLQKKTKYYFRIRKVKKDGRKKYVSPWKTKSVKVK